MYLIKITTITFSKHMEDFVALGEETTTEGPSFVPGSRIPRCSMIVPAMSVLTCLHSTVDDLMQTFLGGNTADAGGGIWVGAPYVVHDALVALDAIAVDAVSPPKYDVPDYYFISVQIWHEAPPRVTDTRPDIMVDVGAIPDVCRASMGLLNRMVSPSELWIDDRFFYYRMCLLHVEHTMQQLQDAVAREEGWPPGRDADISMSEYGDVSADDTVGALLYYAQGTGADDDEDAEDWPEREACVPRIDWPGAGDMVLQT